MSEQEEMESKRMQTVMVKPRNQLQMPALLMVPHCSSCGWFVCWLVAVVVDGDPRMDLYKGFTTHTHTHTHMQESTTQ